MHRIGVISDTHGLLRPEVLERLRGCEVIVHGGDINRQEILDKLEQIAPVYAVRGNNDKEWAKNLPETLRLDLFGMRILMIHNKKEVPKDLSGIDAVIYGHSHRYEEKHIENRLWLNPGSCGPRRFMQPITMAILKIEENGALSVEKIEIPFSKPEQTREDQETIPVNIKDVIETVMKDADRGKSVKQIARRNKIREELADQICRMYFTHPGVDADGIMTRLGL